MTERPIYIPEQQIKDLYRFADRKEEVNWEAKYKPNPDFIKKLLPYIYNYTAESIKRVTFNKDSLKAVIGLSGGLDSSAATLIVAESMRRTRKAGRVNDNSLVLVTFRGMSEEDLVQARLFAQYIKSEYEDLPISYLEEDLTELLTHINALTDKMVSETGRKKIYSGELATRLISSCVLEYGDKTGHCAIDTTNGTEILLGEFVIGAGADYAPISDFYKSQVYDMAEALGVPDFILDRPPINSTFGNDKVASYFGETPAGLKPKDAYAVLDPVISLIHDKGLGPRKISEHLGHSLKFTENVYKRVKNQGHRMHIPYFVVNDRWTKIRRTAKDIPKEDLRSFMRIANI